MKKIILLISLLFLLGCENHRPESLGLTKDKKFRDCPVDTKNCVSSFEEEKKKYMEPYEYQIIARKKVYDLLKAIVKNNGGEIYKEENYKYIHFVFTSKVFSFKDDVEFYFPKEEKKIYMRSGSREGYSDFNVNRKRLEEMLKELDTEIYSKE